MSLHNVLWTVYPQFCLIYPQPYHPPLHNKHFPRFMIWFGFVTHLFWPDSSESLHFEWTNSRLYKASKSTHSFKSQCRQAIDFQTYSNSLNCRSSSVISECYHFPFISTIPAIDINNYCLFRILNMPAISTDIIYLFSLITKKRWKTYSPADEGEVQSKYH